MSGKTTKHVLMLLPLQGATAPIRDTQGVASLALGSVLHWAFSPHLQSQNGCLSIRGGKTMTKPLHTVSLLIAMW